MDNDSESKKLGVVIFGQQFCNKLEHIPIKKRILLRDSVLCQRTLSSAEVLDQKICSLPVTQNSNLLGSPSAAQHSDTKIFSKQQADNLKEIVVLNYEKADCHAAFSGITTKDIIAGNTVDNANKVPKTEALSPLVERKCTSPSFFAPVAKDDDLGTKSTESQPDLSDNVTEDSFFDDKSKARPGHASCKDLEAVQSLTQDNRILWDLNVEMDAWEKPSNHLNVESKSEVTTSDVQSGTNLERSEDLRLKRETLAVYENDTGSNIQPTFASATSGGICEHKHEIPDSAVVSSIREYQHVSTGSFPHKACSVVESSLGIASMNIPCNHELTSNTVEPLTSIHGEKASDLLARAPGRYSGNSFEAPNNSIISTEEQNCENKNIIIEGEGSVNILQVYDDEDYGSSKRGENAKSGKLDLIDKNSCAEQLEMRVSVEEGNLNRKFIAETIQETIKAAPSAHLFKELTENSSKHVDNDVGNQLVGSAKESCYASSAEPPCVPVKCKQDVNVINQVPVIDKDLEAENEQDYEDGELRDLDMHYWNENETEMGETECLDYEPFDENMDDLDESQTSVTPDEKGEGGLKSKKCRLSETLTEDHLVGEDDANADSKLVSGLNGAGHGGTHMLHTQLEKKLSGWDQLPKDEHTSLEKVHEAHRILSRLSRSELQSCINVPTLSEDAEEKETVVERRIRSKDMDASYPVEIGFGSDKFSGKGRSTHHMHVRNRAENWESERRSSVNYHDLYDNHSGSSRMIINSKGRELRRSRSPSDKSEAYYPRISYSRYSRGRYGGHVEGSGRSLRGARNGYRGSLTDDRSEPELRVRQQFLRRDGSFSPRATRHFSETVNRSRSRSRTRSPPLWLPPYERMGSRGHRRSPEFSTDDRVKRTRLPFWKSNFTSDSEMRYTSPPHTGFTPHNKSRWNDDEDFDVGGPRDRSPVRSYRHKENFDASCSRGRFKSSEDFRPLGYHGRMREIASPDRDRGYIGEKDRRKHEDGFETGHQKRHYKGGLTQQYRQDAEDDIAPQNFCSKDFLEDGETRSVNMRKKESRTHERYEYPGSTPNAKR
ncbi:unnamed protein product [Rhodiola kirilowii]